MKKYPSMCERGHSYSTEALRKAVLIDYCLFIVPIDCVLHEQSCGLQPQVYRLTVQREKINVLLQVMKYEDPLNWKKKKVLWKRLLDKAKLTWASLEGEKKNHYLWGSRDDISDTSLHFSCNKTPYVAQWQL